MIAGTSGLCLAQVIVTDSIPKSKMFGPTLVRIGTDLVGLGHTVINESRDAWEFQVEMDIYRYFLAGSFGNEIINFAEEDYDYSSQGTYWRFGIDINMIPRDAYGSVLYFGIRQARSSFSEEFNGTISDPDWGELGFDTRNENLRAKWTELVAGMKARIWKNMYLGYALRVKVGPEILNGQEQGLETFWIPGFGQANQNTFFGVNYYLAWQFPIRPKYMISRQD